MKRYHIKLTGCVQGVGFRPYVVKLANRQQLTGWIKNTGQGVTLEVQGSDLDCFIKQMKEQLPQLARITTIDVSELTTFVESHFMIRQSSSDGCVTHLPQDTAICQPCIDDLLNENSRFHHYPFVSCTDCGPRMTSILAMPYDRKNTTFSAFKLCKQCHRDYIDPNERRHHAQTIVCNHCGPRLSHSINEIALTLQQGGIVAVKGVGGFHLYADANNDEAVNQLRVRKKRPTKPFALMALNVASVKLWLIPTAIEQQLLQSPRRPIVLMTSYERARMLNVAPDLNQWGVMLPSTAFHYLLFYHLLQQPNDNSWRHQAHETLLIATSANVSGEPLIIDNDSPALKELADLVVTHDLPIASRLDDSVVQIVNHHTSLIRRAKGYVPEPIQLPEAMPRTLALGSLLKNTLCFTRDDQAYISQPHGDLSYHAVLQWALSSIKHYQKLFGFTVEQLVIDSHPNHPMRGWASRQSQPLIETQHHHAHLAQVMCEYQLQQPLLGLALDGFGLGDDNSAWGGELLLCEKGHYRRIDKLITQKMPGGDKAAIDCWRMALSVISDKQRIPEHLRDYPHIFIKQLCEQSINSPLTSSMGRVFDAAASLLNVCQKNSFDGEAAMRLEAQVTTPFVFDCSWKITAEGLDFSRLLQQLAFCQPQEGANGFHGSVIAGLTQWLCCHLHRLGLKQVLLAGGCFHNRVLTLGLIDALEKEGITSYLSTLPNDSGLSLGQAWIAGQRQE